jgi:hypothetical protein
MAQTGFTPIQLYSSSTATNVPLAANLATGELAINITDGKLFYKDNAAAVQVIGWKTTPTSAGGTGLISYTAGDMVYYASGTTLSKLAIGTTDYVMTSSGTAPQWSASLKAKAGGTGQTSYAVGDLLYADTTTTLAKLADVATGNALISGGVGVAPSYGKIGLTTHVSGTLPTANGGTNLTSFTSGGVVYASSTSALATGSVLSFDGTSLGIGTSSPTKKLEVQSSTSGGQQARFIDNSGVGGGGRGGGISMGGVSNDTGPVYTDYGRILALKTNATQGNTQGFLLFQVNDGSAQASAMSISSARIVTMDAYGSGTATFSAAGVISSVSDETWKIKDGVPTDPDAMLKKLEPGYWYYNDEKKEIFGVDRQLGFYAQNVNAAIGPEAAPPPEEGKPWGYYDRSVLAVTVMSLQKALATIELLNARITDLERT